jgi:protein ImuB
MPVNSALALAPGLVLGERHVRGETAALARLATWAGRFTPAVSISPEQALLLDIQASLRLFNGLGALRTTVARGLRALGHEARMACAPTARAALWLARAGIDRPVLTPGELRQVLPAIQLEHLGWPERTVQALRHMGLATVGDCLRLPRDGFARRLGAGRLRELDQALGRHPDPQRFHVPPARFATDLELPVESADAACLLEGFQQLFQRLMRVLVARQASVRTVWCRLTHGDGRETRLRLAQRQAAGVGLLPGLLRLRLEAVTLPAPVVRLALQADLEPGQQASGTDLLGQSLQPDGALPALLARLRARLGPEAVQGCALRDDHRPESAWRAVAEPLVAAGSGSAGPSPLLTARSRPVWLLPAPKLLGLVAGRPAWNGALALECGPERIESGWWDGADVRRDYYRASNPRGAMLWVYQDLRSQHWYLQGLFG